MPSTTIIDFEGGILSPLYWHIAQGDWALSQNNTIEGVYSLASKSTVLERTSVIETKISNEKGFVSFDYSIDNFISNNAYFYINGQLVMNFNGLVEGTKTFPLEAGFNELKWHFYTDQIEIPDDSKQFTIDNIEITMSNLDQDTDGLDDSWELYFFGNLSALPGDDADGDGLTNLQESTLRTNPNNSDTDSDGIPDGWEYNNGLSPINSDDARLDSDGDGYSNFVEYSLGTDINDSNSFPSETIINFETGELEPFVWRKVGEHGWVVDSNLSLSGDFSLRAEDITHNQRAEIITGVVVDSESKLTFDMKVSSEGNFDYLRFYINGVLKNSWSSEVEQQVAYDLTPGNYILKWTYSKDSSVDSGSDTAWIDNILIDADPNTDSDTDGVQDSWELAYFGNLTFDLSADQDNDGLSNIEEYSIRTNPLLSDTDADGISDGWEYDNQLDPNNAVDALEDTDADSFNNLDEYWGQTNPNDINDYPQGVLVNFEGVEISPLNWVMEGTSPWALDNAIFSEGIQSLRSGVISHSQNSITKVAISAFDGFIRFDAKVDAQSCCDTLKFYIDDTVIKTFQLSEFKTYYFPISAGPHELKWEYSKDGGTSTGLDVAWIDNVFITAAEYFDNTPPGHVTPNLSVVNTGTQVDINWSNYDAVANGDDIASYQVYQSNVQFTDTANATLINTFESTVRSYRASSLERDTEYYFAVVAVDLLGNKLTTVNSHVITTNDSLPPSEVRSLSVDSNDTSISVNWEVSTSDDIAGYQLIFNNGAAIDLPATTLNYEFTGLTQNSAYDFRIKSVDTSGNVSNGLYRKVATLYDNPPINSIEALSGRVDIQWNRVEDNVGINRYHIYVSRTPITDITGLSPTYSAYSHQTSASIARLTNGIEYHFAIAVENVNGFKKSLVTSMAATPGEDSQGPNITSVTLNSAELVDGAVLTSDGTVSVTAQDQSGVSRVEFYLDGTLFDTKFSSNGTYSTTLEVANIVDGNHNLLIKAYDTLDFATEVVRVINVDLPAPDAPTWTSPANNSTTNESRIDVVAQANATEYQITNNGSIFQDWTAYSGSQFQANIELSEGENQLMAKVRNRGGESAESSVLMVNLDTTVPEAPTGLVATSKAMGQIQLSWNASSGDRVAGYDVYRSNSPFDNLSAAERVNNQHLSVTRFDDMPEDDGTYYYRVVAINELETPSQLSNSVEAVADSAAPTATLSYEPLGAYNAATETYGRGEVSVTIEVSEPLLTVPFVAIKPADGAIQMLDLQKTSETIYIAKLIIDQDNQSGMSTATFSAKDKIGNQGTDIIEGLSITIDSKGPSVIALATEPAHPIKNDELTSVSVTVNFSLDEAVKSETTPTLGYRLSGANRLETAIDNVTAVEGQDNQWTASFELPSDAGLAEVELLSFVYQAEDALNNLSTEIDNSNRIQVYQGDLPPLDTPFGLKAEAQAGGQIKISWYEIPEAADYQLYRQAPQETELTEFVRVGAGDVLEYLDATGLDGEYRYAIASVRQSNGEETLSAMSEVITASADSQLPEAPTNLTLELTPIGIQANWELSTSDGIASYQLYRAATNPIDSVEGLEAAIEGIPASSPSVVDQSPEQTLPAYVVVAVDEAGNLSAPSNTAYLNVELFPVVTLEVEQLLDQNPVVSWTHQNADIAGFDLYLGDKDTGFKVNDSVIASFEYSDSGYANDNRQYTVVAKDSNGVESLPRSIFLPKLDIQLKKGELLRTNLINELEFLVTNHNSQSYSNNRLKLVIAGREHLSENFSLGANATELIKVVVGGYEELSTLSDFEVTWESKPSSTETISVKRNGQVEVLPGALNVTLETKEMVRGGAGQVRFSIDNTGEAMMELITALSRGNADSRDIRFILRDLDGNVLATQKFKQALGDSVLTLATGQTVVRIPVGQTWVSSWVDFDIPAASPEQVILHVEIDKIYRNVGQPEVVSLKGTNTSRELSLVDTPYTGGAVLVSPVSSFGDEDITITGKAIERATLAALPNVDLKLVITVNGFEKVNNVTTDPNGDFSYTYVPENNEAGTYKVSVIHPELTERPDDGQFVINDVVIRPNNLTVRIPKRYTQELPIAVTGRDGTDLTNVRFELIAEEQPNATFPDDINLVFAEPTTIGSNQRKNLYVQMTPSDGAAEQGSFVLSLMSDESGTTPIGQAVVNYSLTEAQPALYYSPSFVETGVTLEGEVSETITLENKGVDTMRDINLELLRQDGFAAPSWLSMNVNSNFGDIEVGQQRQLTITARPQNQAAPGVYEFKLRVSSSNHPVRDIPVYVSLTESGVGGYQFKVSDMYTATLDPNGNLIQGLQGATIRMQNEDVPSIEFSLRTNELGEVLFDNLPAGRYSYWASADKHLEKHGRLDVRPGVIRNESVFLDYQLITLEWSVCEITIEDRYEIVLTATYEVDVPAAVVVLAPSSATLPDMQPGDVFYGELTITNHGLIRADEVVYNLPQSDQYYQFEFLTSSLPETLEAKEVKRIPYRITALQSLEPEVDGTGGGCYSYRSCMDTTASYQCANGDESTSGSTSCWTRSYGSCGGGSSSGGGGWFGGGGGGGYGGGTGGADYDPPEQSPLPPCAADGKDCGSDGNGSGDQ